MGKKKKNNREELTQEELLELEALDEEIADEEDFELYAGGGTGCLFAFILIFLITLGVGIGTLKFYRYVVDYNEAYMPEVTEKFQFTIREGQSTTAIANNLLYSDFIDTGTLTKYIFILKTKFLGYEGKYQAGSFSLSPSMTMEEIMETLQDADMQTKRFTIPEGLNLVQVGEKLEEQEICTADEFYAALEDAYGYGFVPEEQYADPTGKISVHGNRLEGFLFPDTYEVFLTATPHDIVDKMLSRFAEVYTSDLQSRAAELEMSTAQVITVASLIERECRVDAERPLIASVIYNRISTGMKLQIDATVQYALGEVKPRLTYDDLKIDSPYNTYVIDGIPAAPIASPGKASIQAALNPEASEYFYYVLKSGDSTEHNFAKDAKEFEAFKAEYLKTLD